MCVCVCVCERKRFSLRLVFDICGLQFGIVREVCYHLVLVLWFVDLLSLDALQLLNLLCDSLWFVCNSYLVFVNLWFLGLYLVLWFCICERELFRCIEIWVCESASTPICIIPNLL